MQREVRALRPREDFLRVLFVQSSMRLLRVADCVRRVSGTGSCEVLDQESQRMHICPTSEFQPSHLEHFHAAGRLLGWALRAPWRNSSG